MALTPEAVVEVQLLDVSLADAAARLIAEQTIKPEHQVPIPFELSYDPADIDDRMSYAVRATIHSGGKTLFITDRSYPVLTRGHPARADLVLVRSSKLK
jgi:putative lipoprotein